MHGQACGLVDDGFGDFVLIEDGKLALFRFHPARLGLHAQNDALPGPDLGSSVGAKRAVHETAALADGPFHLFT